MDTKCPKCGKEMIWMSDYDREEGSPAVVSIYYCQNCGHQEELVMEINSE